MKNLLNYLEKNLGLVRAIMFALGFILISINFSEAATGNSRNCYKQYKRSHKKHLKIKNKIKKVKRYKGILK